jgi:hypothetical protein
MSRSERLTKEEFSEMLRLLKRHAETDMDQWAEWKLESSRGTIYIMVSNAPLQPEEFYNDVTSLLGP